MLSYLPTFLGIICLSKISKADEVCYGELGCFTNEFPFYRPPQRPVAHLPWSPEEIGTKFQLYTRFNQYTARTLSYDNPSTITESTFSPYKKTKMIVHGFNSRGDTSWVLEMKNAILNAENVNVIVVDWRVGAAASIYGQAATNTRVVGAQIGYLIKVLRDTTGSWARDFHVIGHSLGGHTAGYAGDWLNGEKVTELKLGRITGMDAAGPWFENTNPKVRLDPADAIFVDAIHTDSDPLLNLGWGIAEPVAHADFYPNGGRDQPACPGNEVDSGGFWKISCSHSRAHELFTDSILNWQKPMYGYRCQDYQTYKDGGCPNCPATGCPTLGYFSNLFADSTEDLVEYYLTTGSEAPYSSE